MGIDIRPILLLKNDESRLRDYSSNKLPGGSDGLYQWRWWRWLGTGRPALSGYVAQQHFVKENNYD